MTCVAQIASLVSGSYRCTHCTHIFISSGIRTHGGWPPLLTSNSVMAIIACALSCCLYTTCSDRQLQKDSRRKQVAIGIPEGTCPQSFEIAFCHHPSRQCCHQQHTRLLQCPPKQSPDLRAVGKHLPQRLTAANCVPCSCLLLSHRTLRPEVTAYSMKLDSTSRLGESG